MNATKFALPPRVYIALANTSANYSQIFRNRIKRACNRITNSIRKFIYRCSDGGTPF